MSATTPHRPNMASYQTPSQTPARRVLGSLTPKALNTPQTQTKPYELAHVARPDSPLKHVAPRTPAAFADKENLATPNATVKSKKRGIQEVDDAETIAHAKMLAHARGHSPSTTAMRLTADAIQKHTVSLLTTADASTLANHFQGKQPHRPRRPRIAHGTRHAVAVARAGSHARISEEQPVLFRLSQL